MSSKNYRMKRLVIFLLLGLLLSCLTNNTYAQQPMTKNSKQQLPNNQQLSAKDQAIVLISAYTAQGNMIQLKSALNSGLDAGLTINEIKEVIVQLYAYAGFPRSLNALHNLMDVIKERSTKGLKDDKGKEAAPLPIGKNKLEFGTEMQTKLVGQPVKGEVYQFAPVIDQFLKEHLFGDIFGRDNLSWKTREIATISALASLGGVENQLRSHFGVGMYNGVTQPELHHLVSLIKSKVGAKEGAAAKEVLQNVLAQRGGAPQTTIQPVEQNKDTLFPKGQLITNDNFVGAAWLEQLVTSDKDNAIQVGNVTFEPGARTKWHLHPGGQILLVTSGVGYYQEKEQPKKVLRKGDVVKCPPNVPHWHGASHDSEFVQIAISSSEKGATVWMHPVTNEEYNSSK